MAMHGKGARSDLNDEFVMNVEGAKDWLKDFSAFLSMILSSASLLPAHCHPMSDCHQLPSIVVKLPPNCPDCQLPDCCQPIGCPLPAQGESIATMLLPG